MTAFGGPLQPYQHCWSEHTANSQMLLLFLRYGAVASRAFVSRNCQNILNICFIRSPNFPKCKHLCLWTVMYHYHISVGQAHIHCICLEHGLTRHRSIVPFHEPVAIPKSLASLAAHKAHVVPARKISPWGCMPPPSMTEQRHKFLLCTGNLWIGTLWGGVGLWLLPYHPSFPLSFG